MGEQVQSSGSAGRVNDEKFVRRVQAILSEIARHKWLESEKAGRDIGGNQAARDWMLRYYEGWKRNSEYGE